MLPSLPARRTYIFGEFELQLAARTLLRNGVRLPLGSKAFELLACLVENSGQVVSKEVLLATVWPDANVEENNLSQHVFALRKALGDQASLIATIPGRGYQFTGNVQLIGTEAGSQIAATETIVHTMRERAHVVIEETVPISLAQPLQLGNGNATPWTRKAIPALALVVAAALGWGAWSHYHRTAAGQTHGLLVADFANSTGDETFDRSLKRAIEIELGQSPALSVMSAGEAVGLLPLMGQKPDAAITGDLARELCVRGNKQMLLTGSIASVGTAYLLTLEAADCNTGKKVASAKAQAASKEAVLGALDQIADDVRKKLGESAISRDQYEVPISQATTASLDALKAYSMGQYLAAQGADETQFIGFYQRAVELDPKFAMAWGGLANTYYNLNEFELASENYKKAFDLSDRVSEHEKLILRAHYYGEGVHDEVQAVREYQVWAATYPQEWAPEVNICNGYTQIGQYAAAIPACKRGLEMQPERGISYSVLARALKCANRFDEAKAVGAEAIRRGKDSTGLHTSLYQIAEAEHDTAAVAREIEWARQHSDAWYSWSFPLMQASAAATAGRYRDSLELDRQAYDAAAHQNLAESARDVLLEQAVVEGQLGLQNQARETLGRISGPIDDLDEIAMLRASMGDAAAAEQFSAKEQAKPHPSTMATFVTLPTIRANLALLHGKPQEAIEDLEPATPYEMEGYTVPSLRAAAYMKAGKPDLAEMEYQKILANPGVNPDSPLYPLAHLGLARAYLAAGDKDRSRAEYAAFLSAWKNADPDMPHLKAAQAEAAKLGK